MLGYNWLLLRFRLCFNVGLVMFSSFGIGISVNWVMVKIKVRF